MDVDSWYRQCCQDLEKATEADVASYMYNDPAIQKVLVRRLLGAKAFALNVYIDAEVLRGAVPKNQKTCLNGLRSAGAHIYLGKGPGRQGAFHSKAVVVDRRYLYSGGANITANSRNNEELCYRMVGPVVHQVLSRCAVYRQRFELWDGR
jgi:phosphatidylserine/phosphatidylglycerophosphate/cardiolipin synthase-like enzyme